MGNLEADGDSVNGRLARNKTSCVTQEQRRQKRKERDRYLISRLQRLLDELAKIDSLIAELDTKIAELKDDLLQAELLKQTSFNRMHSIEDILTAVGKDGLTDKHREELKRILGDGRGFSGGPCWHRHG